MSLKLLAVSHSLSNYPVQHGALFQLKAIGCELTTSMLRCRVKICPHCRYQNREGYMFCEDCGEDLAQVESVRPGTYLAPAAVDPEISLQFQGRPHVLALQLQARTVLGRRDAERTRQPDIDLTEQGALEMGVSGLHAAIQHTADGVQLFDLGSTNGTYLNGRRLAFNQAYILRDGDEIRFGRLIANIRIKGLA